MAAEVDFGDLELFEAFEHLEESIPKAVHTRFKDDASEEENENGVDDAGLRERLRQCEETIKQLRAENILPAGWALSPGRVFPAAPRGGRGRMSHEARIPKWLLRSGERSENAGLGAPAFPGRPALPASRFPFCARRRGRLTVCTARLQAGPHFPQPLGSHPISVSATKLGDGIPVPLMC